MKKNQIVGFGILAACLVLVAAWCVYRTSADKKADMNAIERDTQTAKDGPRVLRQATDAAHAPGDWTNGVV